MIPSWVLFGRSVLTTSLSAAFTSGGRPDALPGSAVPAPCVPAYGIAAEAETRALTLEIPYSRPAAMTTLAWTISHPEAAGDWTVISPHRALAAKSRLEQYNKDALGWLAANGVQRDLFRDLRASPENCSNRGTDRRSACDAASAGSPPLNRRGDKASSRIGVSQDF